MPMRSPFHTLDVEIVEPAGVLLRSLNIRIRARQLDLTHPAKWNWKMGVAMNVSNKPEYNF